MARTWLGVKIAMAMDEKREATLKTLVALAVASGFPVTGTMEALVKFYRERFVSGTNDVAAVCNGCVLQGTACGACSRCDQQLAKIMRSTMTRKPALYMSVLEAYKNAG